MAQTAFCTLWLGTGASKCIIVWETALGWHWLLGFGMNGWEKVIYFSLSVTGIKLNDVFFPCLKFWSQIFLAAWSLPISSFLVFPLHVVPSLFSWEPVLGSSFVSWYSQLVKLLENAVLSCYQWMQKLGNGLCGTVKEIGLSLQLFN